MMAFQRMPFSVIVGRFVLFAIIFAAFFVFVESFMVRTVSPFCFCSGIICVTVTVSLTRIASVAASMSMSHDGHG